MKEIKTSDINNININNDIRLLLKNKNDISLKAWSFLYDILQKYNVEEAYAFDINIDLINCYNVIKSDVNELITKLKQHLIIV